MKIKMYQVDAFTNKVFGGNPAAICLLDRWLPDEILQAIATENNLPETAYIIPKNDNYLLRWFTPTQEVDLCGHATLASAYVIFTHLKPSVNKITFHTLSGLLIVEKHGSYMQMDFPALPFVPSEASSEIITGLKIKPLEVYRSTDYLVIVESVSQLSAIKPDLNLLAQLDLRGVIVSARGEDPEIDFVSRFFGPKLNIPEDPITGSAHCVLVPYWATKLNKITFQARQLSAKNIFLRCELKDNRVLLFGEATPYLEGYITVPENH